ncbi:MAG: lanthionine synthetase LanC family protein, partial [Acidobacteriota bacterium]
RRRSSMRASAEDRVLRAYVEAYSGEVAALRGHDVSRRQPPPYSALAHGAGGIAYMWWQLGDVHRARRWLAALIADRRRAAYAVSGVQPPASALLYGRAGLHWLAAATGASTAPFVRLARRPADDVELVQGAPGLLAGARLLLAHEPDAAVHAVARALAERILARVRTRSRRPWRSTDAFGFAHGWPGALGSLLAWLAFTREPPPRWLVASLHRLRRAWSPRDADPRFAASWCNGAAGTLLLWTAAFAATGDDAFLAAARTAAVAALAADEQRSYVCCGRAGIAFALLSLARHDPAERWIGHARRLAVAAAEPQPMTWPNGLYFGHPGIVCLAAQLACDRPEGFPAFER